MRAAAKSKPLLACLCLLWSTFAPAQTQTTARISGTVHDVQGAAIAKADVVAEHIATGERWTAATDDSGSFVILSLVPGSYRLRVQAQGFSITIVPALVLNLADTTNLNMVLQVAQANVEVNVSDAPPLVSTSGSELGTTLQAQNLSELPTPGRNVLQLLMLAPGVTAPLSNNSQMGRNSPNVSVNGARVTQNSYQINGVDANNISVHDFANVAVPAQETVAEVKVQTSMYDATVVGAGGGSIQLITRTGTNTMHGHVY